MGWPYDLPLRPPPSCFSLEEELDIIPRFLQLIEIADVHRIKALQIKLTPEGTRRIIIKEWQKTRKEAQKLLAMSEKRRKLLHEFITQEWASLVKKGISSIIDLDPECSPSEAWTRYLFAFLHLWYSLLESLDYYPDLLLKKLYEP